MKKGFLLPIILLIGTIGLLYGAQALLKLEVSDLPSTNRTFNERLDKLMSSPSPTPPLSVGPGPQTPISSATNPSPATQTQTSSNSPSITSVTPQSGKSGEPIIIKGTNFGTYPGTVIFESEGSGGCCGVRTDTWSETEIQAKVIPSGPKGQRTLKVFRPDGKLSNSVSFEILQ